MDGEYQKKCCHTSLLIHARIHKKKHSNIEMYGIWEPIVFSTIYFIKIFLHEAQHIF